MLVSEVVRGKALALVLEKAKVTDESGRRRRPRGAARGRGRRRLPPRSPTAEDDEPADGDDHDHDEVTEPRGCTGLRLADAARLPHSRGGALAAFG